MAGRLELPFSPSTIDCLSWSKDNLIAVAGGESIGILTPRFKDRGANGTYWDSTVFKANAFTAEEIPLVDLLPFKLFSIAEELSSRHVCALKWSSPGLGRYGRSVLAVLSSNHVLSIWENAGRLDASADWKRTVVVNHALQKHYRSGAKTGPGSQVEDGVRQIRGNRVRAFAWSPPVYKEWAPSDSSTPFTDYGHQFLAVSNEHEDILLLRVISPHNLLSPATQWRIEVTNCFNVGGLTLQAIETDGSDDTDEDERALADNVYIADHLAWGPSKTDDPFGMRSTLAFIARGRLFCTAVECSPYHVDTKASLVDHQCYIALSRSDLTGPLTFIPETQSVIVFGADAIICVDTARSFNDDKCSTMHHLDGRWDEVSGVAFSDSTTDTLQVHIASVLSSAESSTSTLSLPLDMDEVSRSPTWQRALMNLKTGFKAKHKLPGGVQERVWGMASSPMGDLIATATFLLPLEAVSYMQPGEQRTHVTITKQPLARNSILPANAGVSPSCDVSHSLLLSSLTEYLKGRSTTVGTDVLVAAMQDCAKVAEDKIDYELDIPIASSLEPVQHVRYLRLRLFLMPGIRTARFALLAEMAKRETQNADQITKLAISDMVKEVMKIPASFAQAGDFSRRIHAMYTAVKSKLEPSSADASSTQVYQQEKEKCCICKENIAFESVKWARCAKGHQFVRCGLTFLAMQKPGVTKTCGICATQFLDEWKLDALRVAANDNDVVMQDLPKGGTSTNGNSAEARVGEEGWAQLSYSKVAEPEESLARLLFAAFDHCVYCGGNF